MLEDASFDGIFFADTVGVHDVHAGSAGGAMRDAAQFPINDPTVLISGMAAVTEHLTFGVTCSLTYEQPYLLARRFSSLDHLTGGRVGWNIVTSYSESAARNLGKVQQLSHDERYDLADEYMDVVYKLWESSFDDDAVTRDVDGATYVDPAKVHPITHSGTYFNVPGFHLCEPSPQRTPVLFQAGASSKGMAFGGKHAEAVFINTTSVTQAKRSVDKIGQAAVDAGRDPRDIKVVALITVVVAATDEEAQAKYEHYLQNATAEGALARFSGWTGIDMSEYDLDTPLRSSETRGGQSILDMFSKADPDRDWTPRQIAEFLSIGGTGSTIVGSPETVAAELRRWRDEGDIDGINLSYTTKPGGWEEFIELALPELRAQGIVSPARPDNQEPVTLREKLYPGHTRTLDAHPASAYRAQRLVGSGS
ncbi:Coenzyme F420-dependent N5,N10-methylene tetrahydromethanopterin reductase and related flavin-dependent oxidoreductases [Rhodococcus wratislaviensis]|uniref:Coenzyme F420-dependent N5,N10-methylene tetrahydromethanopterin reductase and related flavin-dependent oxidoreductases n=2 Tax=Rhodococcus wratislaviensis TaxID=44752 RepID=A0A402C3S9_RHOWR|nr:Coenzyme F420-dependent N5,N10-methylene tetrahydromethanopterin reductase and related flavin-dependent oxidoreductases [Rhodococcus wratislaviensis]